MDIQLASLYATHEPVLKINVVSVQQQRGGVDCGVFAAAVSLVIASGDDPANIRWRQSNMRAHLRKCIESKSSDRFPLSELLSHKASSRKLTHLTLKSGASVGYRNLQMQI